MFLSTNKIVYVARKTTFTYTKIVKYNFFVQTNGKKSSELLSLRYKTTLFLPHGLNCDNEVNAVKIHNSLLFL